jgi:hypothetical protein
VAAVAIQFNLFHFLSLFPFINYLFPITNLFSFDLGEGVKDDPLVPYQLIWICHTQRYIALSVISLMTKMKKRLVMRERCVIKERGICDQRGEGLKDEGMERWIEG